MYPASNFENSNSLQYQRKLNMSTSQHHHLRHKNTGATQAQPMEDEKQQEYDYTDILRQLQAPLPGGVSSGNAAQIGYRTVDDHNRRQHLQEDQPSSAQVSAAPSRTFGGTNAQHSLTDDYRTGDTLARLNRFQQPPQQNLAAQSLQPHHHQLQQPVDVLSSSQTSTAGNREASGDRHSKRQQRQMQEQQQISLQPVEVEPLSSHISGGSTAKNHLNSQTAPQTSGSIAKSMMGRQGSRNRAASDFITFNDAASPKDLAILQRQPLGSTQPGSAGRGGGGPPPQLGLGGGGVMSTVTSSELLATIADQRQQVLSPAQLLTSERGELIQPITENDSLQASSQENIAPNMSNPVADQNDDDYRQLASCEQDLQDLAKLRLKTLEEIIQDKLLVIEQLQNENQAERSEKAKVIEQVRERQSVITNYETRFLQVRAIIEKQDAELRAAHSTLDQIRSQLQNEELKSQQLKDRLENQELQSRTNIEELNAKVEHHSQENTDRVRKQMQEFEQKLVEKDKWLEAMQIRHQADLQALGDSKDKEVSALQEQLQTTYKDMASEIEQLQHKIIEVTHDNDLKLKMSSQQLLSSQDQHKLLNEHIAKLQGIIQSKSEMCQGLDIQNQTLLQEVQHARQAATEAQTELAGLRGQSLDEIQHMRNQLAEVKQEHQNGLSEVARDHEREKRQLERANKKTVKQFEKIREQVKDKERTVKQEIERVLSEWEQKCQDLEDQVQESRTALLLAENASKQASKDVKFAQKEQKTLRLVLRGKEEEIRTLQRRFEEELEKKGELRVEEQAKHRQVQEKLQFEIDFLKRELEQQMRGREMQYQYQQRRNISASPAAPTLNNFVTLGAAGEQQKDYMRSNQVTAAAGPSPYLAQFVRSNYKQTGSLNDSLDKLKMDFMHGYNEAMAESDAAYRLETQKKQRSTVGIGGGGPLQQMLQVGNVSNGLEHEQQRVLLQEENEALKKVIGQMKVDMETIVDKVKSTYNDQISRLQQQQQDKQSQSHHSLGKIKELESKVQSREEQIVRLKEERDRLIQISNDLRADLNRSQRLVNDLMNRELSSATGGAGARSGEKSPSQVVTTPTMMGMFDQKLRMSVEDGESPSVGGTGNHAGGIKKHATFGEGQMDYHLRKAREESPMLDPRKSTESRVFDPTGSEHDKILEYGAQLNDIALQLQEWVSIYQSQGSNGGQPLFSINSQALKTNGKKRQRPLQQLTYAPGGDPVHTAFGSRDMATATLRSSRSLGSRRTASPQRSRKRSSRSRASRSASRSKSREGRNFIQKIEKLRKNLEVEGRAIQTFYKEADEQKRQKAQQSEKMTASQYRAANQLLMKQNREMSKKAISSAVQANSGVNKDKKEIRRQMLENARGKVMNYALKQNNDQDDDEKIGVVDFDDDLQQDYANMNKNNQNADLEQVQQIHPLHKQYMLQKQQQNYQQVQVHQQSDQHGTSQQTQFQTPISAIGHPYQDRVNSTLQLIPSTVARDQQQQSYDINLDHDIAGEFEAAVDHSKLESKNKYDFMNLQNSQQKQQEPEINDAYQQNNNNNININNNNLQDLGQNNAMGNSAIKVDAIRQRHIQDMQAALMMQRNTTATAAAQNAMRATGSIMGDADSRASSSFILSTPHYN